MTLHYTPLNLDQIGPRVRQKDLPKGGRTMLTTVKSWFSRRTGPTGLEQLALASVTKESASALSDRELLRLERLCHEGVEAEEEDLESEEHSAIVATKGGIAVRKSNPHHDTTGKFTTLQTAAHLARGEAHGLREGFDIFRRQSDSPKAKDQIGAKARESTEALQADSLHPQDRAYHTGRLKGLHRVAAEISTDGD